MKRVVVTGASKGIGKEIVKKFYSTGHEVIFAARKLQDLEATAKKVEQSGGTGKLRFMDCDVTDKESLKRFYEFAMQSGAPDVLINNAGIYSPGQIHSEEEGVFEKMMATNLNSAYYLTRFFTPDMIKRKSGHIINTCSIASIVPYVNGGSYCISKFALYGLTKVLREEMKEHGISVTAILPGATLTSSWEGTDLPKDRFMQPEDVAEAVYAAVQLAPSTVVEEMILRPFLGDV